MCYVRLITAVFIFTVLAFVLFISLFLVIFAVLRRDTDEKIIITLIVGVSFILCMRGLSTLLTLSFMCEALL